MRYRNRSIPLDCEGFLFYSSSNDPEAHAPGYALDAANPVIRRSEVIGDFNNRRSRPNSAVEHGRYEVESFPVSDWSSATFSSVGLGFYNATGLCDARRLEGTLVLPDIAELQKTANQMVVDRYASVAKSWSLANNLLELGDIPNLIKGLHKYRYLDWKFGIEPLYKDLSTLYMNVKDLKARLNKLRRQNGLKQRFNFRLHSDAIPNNGPIDGAYLSCRYQQVSSVARATGMVTVSVPTLGDLDVNLGSLLDVLGAHLDVVTIYDATPFTWLLDWIFPIGDYLESLVDRRYIRPEITSSDGTISYRIDASCTLSLSPTPFYPDFASKFAGTGHYRFYKRVPFTPTTQLGVYTGQPLAPKMPEWDLGKIAILLGLKRII